MRNLVGRRLLVLAAVSAAVVGVVAAATAAPSRVPNWAGPEIATVVSHGLMAQSVKTFRPNDPLTRDSLSSLDSGLTEALTPPPTTTTTSTDPTTTTETTTTDSTTATETTATATTLSDPNGTVTMAQLDSNLVATLGLSHAAAEFNHGARAAGIPVPSRFGTEVVARLLALRLNHPAAQDFLELRPQDPATRAEAAYSAAQILGFGPFGSGWQTAWVQGLADSFALPQLTTWQRQILTVAFSKIGMPYVWGGTSDDSEVDFGVPARGGYDCSGFVWRVYKLQSYADEGDLASVIQGRTTMVMSVEVPRSKRIGFQKLQPADVLFFGARGPRSKGPQVDHTAIYVGNGWFIQSSGEGVALAQLSGWYRHEFAWGRRPLQEAGLEQ
jgi:cell wall-associated NlpC family hydrolase